MRPHRALGLSLLAVALLLDAATSPHAAENTDGPSRGASSDSSLQQQLAERIMRLKASGPDRRGMSRHIAAVTREWSSIAAKLGAKVQLEPPGCFAAGCLIVTRLESEEVTDQVLGEFSRARGFNQWNSWKMHSAPFPAPQGKIEVTWIFAAPEAGTPVMSPSRLARDPGAALEQDRGM